MGANAPSYAVQSGDAGAALVAVVTAANAAGSAGAASAPTAPVASAPAAPAPSTQTQTFTGSLNGKNSKAFAVTVGTGMTMARLAFSKCSNLSLSLSAANGNSVGNATGPSVVALDATVSAGSYSYAVGGGRCSFTLTVTGPVS